MDVCVKRFKNLSSTNKYLKELVQSGDVLPGTVIIANSQTDGIGQYDRSFFSPADTGLYMSILTKASILPEKYYAITPMVAIAVCRAIEKITNVQTEIKWVNDIYVKRKKVAGILTECVKDNIIIGIGVNICPPKEGFPPDIKNIAGSILDFYNPLIKDRLQDEIIKNVLRLNEKPLSHNILQEYIKRSFLIGRKVSVTLQESKIYGICTGISSEYALQIKENDTVFEVASGVKALEWE